MVSVRSRRLGRAGVISAGALAFILSGGGGALAAEGDGGVGAYAVDDVREATGDALGGATDDLSDGSPQRQRTDREQEDPRRAGETSKEPVQAVVDDVRRTAERLTDLTSPDDPTPDPADGAGDSGSDPNRDTGESHGSGGNTSEGAGSKGPLPRAERRAAAAAAVRADSPPSVISLPALDAAPALGPLRLLSSARSPGDWSDPLALPRLVAPPDPQGAPPPPRLAPPADETRPSDTAQALSTERPPPPASLLAAAAAAVGAVTGGHIGLARLRRRAGA